MKTPGICIARALHGPQKERQNQAIEEHDLTCSDKGGSESAREKDVSLT